MSDSKITKILGEWDDYRVNHPYNDAFDFTNYLGITDMNLQADIVDTINCYEEMYY